jgi:hypothetical protein
VCIHFTIGRGSFALHILDSRFLWLMKSKEPLMSRVSAVVARPLFLAFCMLCVSVSAASLVELPLPAPN